MRIRPTLAALAVSVLAATALPAGASAAITVTSTDPNVIVVRGDPGDSTLSLVSTASVAGGHLSMSGNPESMTLTGPNAAGCIQSGGAGVICNPISNKTIDIDLGGGKGTATINVSATHAPGARVVYHGTDGVDAVNGGASTAPLTIALGAGAKQSVTGGGGPDAITGGPTDDLIAAGGGDDVVDAGDGNDSLTGGAGADRLQGGPGNDVLDGGDDDDPAIDGGFGDDAIAGGKGNDALRGGAGDDTFSSADADGGDLIDGGEGVEDAVSYAARTVPLSLSLNGAADDGATGEGDNIVGMETVIGGQKDDTIAGDAFTNFLSGSLGNDRVDGGEGVDHLRGNDGEDTVVGRDTGLYRDDLGCNLGADVAIADVNDIVASDCEALDRAAAPAGVDPATLGVGGIGPGTARNPTGNGLPPVVPVAPTDTRAPRVTITGLPAGGRVTRRGLRRGLTLRVATDEPARLEVRIVRSVARAAAVTPADNLTLARVTKPRGSGGRTVKLAPVAALLGHGRKALKLVVVATDAAGNTTTASRAVRLR